MSSYSPSMAARKCIASACVRRALATEQHLHAQYMLSSWAPNCGVTDRPLLLNHAGLELKPGGLFEMIRHAVAWAVLSAILSFSQVVKGATVTVDALSNRKPIKPEIYGVAYASQTQLQDLNVNLNRMGGNPTRCGGEGKAVRVPRSAFLKLKLSIISLLVQPVQLENELRQPRGRLVLRVPAL
jgi:hypothetical protein